MVVEKRCLAASSLPWIVERCVLAEVTGKLVEAAGSRIDKAAEDKVRLYAES